MDEFEQQLNNLPLNEETRVKLQEEQDKLIKIIEAISGLVKNKDWLTIQELIFSRSQEAIERQIRHESLAREIDKNKLYRLQGEWAWSRQYGDMVAYAEALKKQLSAIKSKLK